MGTSSPAALPLGEDLKYKCEMKEEVLVGRQTQCAACVADGLDYRVCTHVVIYYFYSFWQSYVSS